MNSFCYDARCAACERESCGFLFVDIYFCVVFEYFLRSSKWSGVYGSAIVNKISRMHSEQRLAFTRC